MENLTGKRFGRLSVTKFAGRTKGSKPLWECVCDCGGSCIKDVYRLIGGIVTDCGCGHKDRITVHGESNPITKEYSTWHKMKDRCLNPNHPHYADYGGRGIKICPRWIDSYENFLADVGRAPSEKHSLDRFPNKDGDYEPINFRWATPIEQGTNKRNNVMMEYNGEIHPVSEWVRRLGIPHGKLLYYANKGVAINQIISLRKFEKLKY